MREKTILVGTCGVDEGGDRRREGEKQLNTIKTKREIQQYGKKRRKDGTKTKKGKNNWKRPEKIEDVV